ncbi:hypothetical protein PI124_g23151 [Phytophthora idaei]|nr:hypothetical protein PI124_g23151 [Phytophthora idaei]
MRTSFLDSEDKALVQVALLFERDGLRITWADVARRVKTKRAPTELRLRLANLKRTYGKRPLFGGGNRIREGQGGRIARVGEGRDAQVRQGAAAACDGAIGAAVAAGTSPIVEGTAVRHVERILRGFRVLVLLFIAVVVAVTQESKLCAKALKEAAQAVVNILGGIRAEDVRQTAGRTQANSGEILPAGVSAIIEAIGGADGHDGFLDIGAGVGNVIAQVALTTSIGVCVGIELPADLCALGQACIRRYTEHLPRLNNVLLKASDAKRAA